MTLPLLLQRVREASGPDRELDIAIGRALMGDDWLDLPTKESFLTASLDSAVALVERVRPLCGWAVERLLHDQRSRAELFVPEPRVVQHYADTGATPALALLAALLASLIPQEAHEDDQG